MRFSKLLSISLLATFGLSAIAQTAMAGMGKETGTGDIYVTGLAAGSKPLVIYPGIIATKSVVANECGIAKLANFFPNSVTFSINGSEAAEIGSLPFISFANKANFPKCVAGVIENAPSGVGVKVQTSDGGPNSLWFAGLTPYQKYEVSYPSVGTDRKVVANACGMIKLSNNGKYEGATSIRMNSTTTDVADIPSFVTPPTCKRGVLLSPAGWP